MLEEIKKLQLQEMHEKIPI